MMIAALVAAAILSFNPDQAPARYTLDLSVTRNGVTTVSTRSVVMEDGHASVSIVDSERVFEMNADLAPVQGDDENGRLYLSLSIVDGDSEPVEPKLVFERGGTARAEIGETDADGRMTDGLSVTVSPETPAGAPRPQ